MDQKANFEIRMAIFIESFWARWTSSVTQGQGNDNSASSLQKRASWGIAKQDAESCEKY